MTTTWETIKTHQTEKETISFQKMKGVEQWQVVSAGKGYEANEIFVERIKAKERFLFLTNLEDDGTY